MKKMLLKSRITFFLLFFMACTMLMIPKATAIAAEEETGDVVEAKDIMVNCRLKLSQYSFIENGEARTPKVYLRENAKIDMIGRKLILGKDFKVTYENNVEAGKAKVYVEGIGKYTGHKTEYFTIRPKGTKMVSVDFNIDTNCFEAKWEQKDDITGYEVSYDISPNEHRHVERCIGKSNTEINSIKPLFVNGLPRYYVSVRTYKFIKGERYYSLWSDCKSFYAIPGVTECSASSTGVGKITLTWEKVKDECVKGYDITVAKDPEFKKIVKKADRDRTIKRITFVDKKSGETYYVRIRTYVYRKTGDDLKDLYNPEKVYSKWSKTMPVVVQ